MGQLAVTEFITLDGVIDSPGEGGWAFNFSRGEEGDRFKADELDTAGAQLLGRITYQGFAAAWPSMRNDMFGERMNSMPKYVVSRTLSAADATWENSTVISADVAAEVTKLKERTEGDVLVAGSANLVRTLAEHDLVDEYRLMIEPILLGGGKRLFVDDGIARTLELVGSTVASTGVIICNYRVVR
jgi:dihydrofolate reductase